MKITRTNNKSSGVVERNARVRRSPNISGETIPPNDIRTRENDETVTFPHVGLKRNAKFVVSLFSRKSSKLLPSDVIL